MIPIGLASTISEKSGEIENPIVKLLKQVARKELSDEAAAAFESVNAKLADSDAMDQHLVGLVKQHPADTDIAAAAAIFAFFQDDIVKAQKRLSHLVSTVEANPKVRAADVGLHLVAEMAATYEETIEDGHKLAKRAKRAGSRANRGSNSLSIVTEMITPKKAQRNSSFPRKDLRREAKSTERLMFI